MKSPPSALRRTALLCALLAAALAPAGCVKTRGGGEILFNSLAGVQTIVVAPVMNLSTSTDLDTTEATNALVSELQQIEGLNVVPIGRVYQYLAAQKVATVGSPDEALALAKIFKAQATVVAAITEYDPYNPPRIGLALQLYAVGGVPAPQGPAGFDPVEAGRSAVPFPVSDSAANRPRDALQHVFSGRSVEVEKLAQLYAKRRMSDGTPLGWRRFIVDQHEFSRLCFYGMIREMVGASGRKPGKTEIIIGHDAGNWPK